MNGLVLSYLEVCTFCSDDGGRPVLNFSYIIFVQDFFHKAPIILSDLTVIIGLVFMVDYIILLNCLLIFS